MEKVKITTEYITLDLLKFVDVILLGRAKIYLASHKVVINGEENNRRGRKALS